MQAWDVQDSMQNAAFIGFSRLRQPLGYMAVVPCTGSVHEDAGVACAAKSDELCAAVAYVGSAEGWLLNGGGGT